MKIGIVFSIALITLFLYRVPLQSHDFILDDDTSIVENFNIRTFDVPKIFNTFNTRFLPGLSFALNYKLNGLNAAGYRLFDLLVHGLNAVLVFLLVRSLLNSPLASLFAALLFLWHPIQTEPINYITERFVLIAAFFYLLTMVLYIRKHYIGSLVSAIAAMFCKEFTVTIPLMLMLYEFYFGHRDFKRLLPFFVIVLIVPLLLLRTPREMISVSAIASVSAGHHKLLVDITRARQGFGRKEYFLTELNVVCTYIRLLFVPVNQVFDYDYPLSHAFKGKTMLCGVFLLALLGIAVWTYRDYRIISFGVLWFFISLSVESSFIPIGHVISEYRVYLASVGFVLAVASLLYSLNVNHSILISVAILAILCVLTYQRNKVWASDLTLWSDTIKKCPNNPWAYRALGDVYRERNNIPQAIIEYDKSIELDPKDPEAYTFMGTFYKNIHQPAQALYYLTKAVEVAPGLPIAYISRGCFYYSMKQYKDAWQDYNRTIELLHGDVDSRFRSAFDAMCQ